ncbi:proline-rich protein 2-like [Choloepus didactylus]|uniref:proline-rich protein 2-like n=1 Tax=Choloepus didactylus TaxID=27675 RepID=UPI0018A072DC|nr:proline-rich protein 2-like [Choloepus didactylus]
MTSEERVPNRRQHHSPKVINTFHQPRTPTSGQVGGSRFPQAGRRVRQAGGRGTEFGRKAEVLVPPWGLLSEPPIPRVWKFGGDLPPTTSRPGWQQAPTFRSPSSPHDPRASCHPPRPSATHPKSPPGVNACGARPGTVTPATVTSVAHRASRARQAPETFPPATRRPPGWPRPRPPHARGERLFRNEPREAPPLLRSPEEPPWRSHIRADAPHGGARTTASARARGPCRSHSDGPREPLTSRQGAGGQPVRTAQARARRGGASRGAGRAKLRPVPAPSPPREMDGRGRARRGQQTPKCSTTGRAGGCLPRLCSARSPWGFLPKEPCQPQPTTVLEIFKK